MFLTDDHLHTKFSFDSTADPDEICQQAITLGLSEITLTDHMDIYSFRPYTDLIDCPAWYSCMHKLRERYAGRLLVHTGIELGQPQMQPKQAQAFLEAYPLDFIIGSMHNLAWNEQWFYPGRQQRPPSSKYRQDFDIYYLDYTEVDPKSFYEDYIGRLLELTLEYEFDVLGHITYPSRYMQEQTGSAPDMKDFYEQFETLFHALIERGRGIELNLSGLARGQGMPMPDPALLRLYRDCKGEIITIGSDAHVSAQAGTISAAGQELLREAGFRYVAWFEERKPHFQLL